MYIYIYIYTYKYTCIENSRQLPAKSYEASPSTARCQMLEKQTRRVVVGGREGEGGSELCAKALHRCYVQYVYIYMRIEVCRKRRKERWRGGSSCIRAYGVSVLGQVFTLAFVPRVRAGGRRELSVTRARFGRGSTRSIRERRGREGERQTIEDSRIFFSFL